MTPLLAQAPQPHFSWFACITCVSQGSRVCILCVSQKQKVCIPVLVWIHSISRSAPGASRARVCVWACRGVAVCPGARAQVPGAARAVRPPTATDSARLPTRIREFEVWDRSTPRNRPPSSAAAEGTRRADTPLEIIVETGGGAHRPTRGAGPSQCT